VPDDRTSPTSPLIDLLFDEAGTGLCLVAPDGTVLRANGEWLRSTPYGPEQVLGKSIVELLPETRGEVAALHARARAGHRVALPRRAQRVDGGERWWEEAVAPVPMDGGTGLLITAREVTAAPPAPRRDTPASHAGRATLQRYEMVVEHSRDVILFMRREDGRILEANAAAVAAYGYGRDELLARSIRDLRAAETLGAMAAQMRDAGGRGVLFESVHRRKDGSTFPVEVSSRGVTVDGTQMLISIVRDITERKRADEALRRSEEEARARASELEAILGCIADGVLVYDSKGVIVRSNPAARDMLDLPDDVRALPVAERVARHYQISSEEGRPLAPDEVPAVLATARGITVRDAVVLVQVGSKAPLWMRVTAAPLLVGGKQAGAVVSMTDVTARKHLELDLVKTKNRLQSVLASITEGHYALDAGWRFVAANEVAERHFGKPAEELLGQDIWSLTRTPPDSIFRQRFEEARETGRPVRFDNPSVVRPGYWAELHLYPRSDGVLDVYFSDVSARKQAEEALREADRRKDEFLGMLSHELRNPLSPIRNSTYILRHVSPGSPQARRAQEVIERQTEHLTHLVDDLLDVTRIARGKIELRRARVDLREVARRMADDFRSVMEARGVRFVSALPDEQVWVDADATRLAQMVGNLLHNAAKFTPRGGAVTLSVKAVAREAEIRVRDTGVGISAELLPSVFEPFVQGDRTLARTEGGLGLGLALVKGIAELHDGTVHAESAGSGAGAEFVVRVPLLTTADVPEPARSGARARNGSCRVLVVDDNADAAESLAQIVRMLGHAPEIAYDGLTALSKVQANPPDVVLCDVGLPGMSGYEVAQALRAAGHQMPLFAVTGYAQPNDVKKAVEAGFDGHVAKPVDVAQLERLLG
jgi:PAS domain S-box-containing protein